MMIALASNTQAVVVSPIDNQQLLQRSQQAAIDANIISQSANDIAQFSAQLANAIAQSNAIDQSAIAIAVITAYASITAATTIVAAMDLKDEF